MKRLGVCILFAMYFTMKTVSSAPATVVLEEEEPALMSSSREAEGKPIRPRLFQSPEQIRMYLDSLGKYYNLHNRNRFGKRSSWMNHVDSYKDSIDANMGPDKGFFLRANV